MDYIMTYSFLYVVCILCALLTGPVIFMTMVRCVVHDRGYRIGNFDVLFALSITGILVISGVLVK